MNKFKYSDEEYFDREIRWTSSNIQTRNILMRDYMNKLKYSDKEYLDKERNIHLEMEISRQVKKEYSRAKRRYR